jgi:hypothetical protein
MHTSSINRICSSSWPSSSAELVSISGKRRRILWAVMGSARVVDVVVDILGGRGGRFGSYVLKEMPRSK